VSSAIATTIIIITTLGLYFLPSILAWRRQHHLAAIFALNLFLGWTLVGWVGALVLALWQNNAPIPAWLEEKERGSQA
jgi:Superinfection immunity protein